MSGKLVYEYAMIRFVPKVERGECINIGVILLCRNKRFLQARFQLDEARLRAFAPEADLEELARYVSSWNLIAQGSQDGGSIAQLDLSSRFRWLTANRSTIIQSSAVHPGLCDDPEWVLADLFEKYVG